METLTILCLSPTWGFLLCVAGGVWGAVCTPGALVGPHPSLLYVLIMYVLISLIYHCQIYKLYDVLKYYLTYKNVHTCVHTQTHTHTDTVCLFIMYL